MKLIVAEAETPALRSYLRERPRLATSRLALVEVTRAVRVANAAPELQARAVELVNGCLLLDVDVLVLARAAELTSRELRSLDAVHLASAESIEPDALLAYDRRLVEAAERLGLTTASPA